MTDYAVELHNVTKVFSSGRSGEEEVYAVKDINLNIPQGEFFTLLGPSGCGKTTTLRLVAGFEMASQGEVLILGKKMNDTPPNLRPVNTVFQNYALFPHLNVEKNIAFGLAVKKTPRHEQQQRVQEALQLVQLADMGRRKPAQLSGGQQQRVALARALVNRPAVLLLDEPLGALDLKLRKAMQLELKQLQKQVGITFIYVTHDQEEALTMSDRIAVMNRGVILQVGDPVSLYENPASRFVADFIGESNFFQARIESVTENILRLRLGDELVSARLADQHVTPGQTALITVRPEKMMLAAPGQKILDGVSGTVQEVVYIGTDTRYIVRLLTGDSIIVRVQNACAEDLSRYHRGENVKVFWKPEDAHLLNE